MLNLSDKELDRLSREAASQYDPGDPTGPGGWDRLELRLDKELGRIAPNPAPTPLRAIRKFPFHYAPILILFVGVSYFFVKQFTRQRKATTGSPPMSAIKPVGAQTSDSSNKTLANSINFTSDSLQQHQQQPGQPAESDVVANRPANADGKTIAGTDRSTTTNADPNTTANANNSATANSGSNGLASTDHSAASKNAPDRPPHAPGATPENMSAHNAAAASSLSTIATGNGSRNNAIANNNPSHKKTGRFTKPGHNKPHNTNPANLTPENGIAENAAAKSTESIGQKAAANNNARAAEHTFIQHPRSLTTTVGNRNRISAGPITLTKNNGGKDRTNVRNQSLSFGLNLAPDFTSVNSLAGDRPGSTIGLTVDYNFPNTNFSIGSGLLYSRKNYTARRQDCQLPPNPVAPGLPQHDIDFVKGHFNTLEIPINLRYDFSSVGTSRFFAQAGTSSYIMLNQQSDYYFNAFGRESFRRVSYYNKQAYIFSSINLSLGVETGINNYLSLLIAPYVKLPTSRMGFEDIKINSVGVNFALKFTPVLSHKRK